VRLLCDGHRARRPHVQGQPRLSQPEKKDSLSFPIFWPHSFFAMQPKKGLKKFLNRFFRRNRAEDEGQGEGKLTETAGEEGKPRPRRSYLRSLSRSPPPPPAAAPEASPPLPVNPANVALRRVTDGEEASSAASLVRFCRKSSRWEASEECLTRRPLRREEELPSCSSGVGRNVVNSY